MPVAHEDDEARPKRHQLKFRQLRGSYAVARLAPDAPVPDWATKGEFTSISRTPDELSIVCPAGNVPGNLPLPDRWMCLKLEGAFPFSLTGILLAFIEPLSAHAIPIFAISTYDTDYVLVPEESSAKAVEMLMEAGHEMIV
jgi:hypothetical protein